jgi:NTP pyrophosphatase (non-canonical NTP hydrolase)
MLDIVINQSASKEVAQYWGKKMPMMAVEELSELTQAISKIERYGNREDLKKIAVEEIGDVLISIAALMEHYGIDEGDVVDRITDKLNKDYRHGIYEWCLEHGVSTRSTNILLRTRMSLETFASLSEKELRNIHGAGKNTVEEFKVMQSWILNE